MYRFGNNMSAIKSESQKLRLRANKQTASEPKIELIDKVSINPIHRLPFFWIILISISIINSKGLLIVSHCQTVRDSNIRPSNSVILKDGSTQMIQSLEDFLASAAVKNDIDKSSEFVATSVINFNKSMDLVDEIRDSSSHEKASISASSSPRSHNENHESSISQVDKESRHHSGTSGHGHKNSSFPKPIPQHWQVKSLLNFTHDYPLAYSQIICGYVWPLMAAITLFTNLMIVFVLTQRDMRTPTNVVLIAIAIADIIPIVVPVPWFVYLFAMGNEKQVLYPPIACYFYQHSTRSVSEIFYFLSTWLNVLLAIHDYLAACLPRLSKKYCQIKYVVIEIISLTLLAFLLNLPQALKLVYKPVQFYYNGQLTWGCRALQARWFKDLVGEYVALYDDIFTAIIVVFVDGGPAVVLITLTALLIRELQRQRIKGHKLMEQARTASKRRRERYRQQEYEASARVMIFVLLAFLAVKIPFATTYTLMIIQSRFEIHFVENLVDFQKAITLTDLVFVLSYPINFTIFCLCSKKFRHKCAQLLGECNNSTKSTRDRLMSSISGSLISGSINGAVNVQEYLSNFRSQQQQLQQESSAQLKKKAPSSPVKAEKPALNLAETTRMIANSHLNLVEEKLKSLNNLCDGQNHLNSLNRGNVSPSATLASDSNFRMLLEDGSLCLDCIIRYEQLKRESEIQRSIDQRHTSCDSSDWSFPPNLQPLRIESQLPQIITSRCDSIRESHSSEEASPSSPERDNKSKLTRQSEASNTSLNGQGVPATKESLDADRATLLSESSSRISSDQQQSQVSGGGPSHYKRLKAYVRRPSDKSDGGNSNWNERQRSLSLSNSNLSTLPNATGMLADVFMSSLFLGNVKTQKLDASHRNSAPDSRR